jgi:hypothetical protein
MVENPSIRMRDGNRCIMSVVRPFALQYPSHVELISQHFDPFSQILQARNGLKELKVDGKGGACNRRFYSQLPLF